MSDFGIYEHVVTREAGRGSKVGRVLWGLLVLLCVAGLLWLGLLWKLFPLFLGLSVGLVFMAFLFFKRYSSLEFEYTIAEGTVTFAEIYGKSARKVTKELEIRSCAVISPEDDGKLADFKAEDVYYATSSPDAENVYGVAYESEKGKRTIVYFEMTEPALRIFRTYNPRATVMKLFR